MARKFILVDQSIAGLAGHHYEYAVHVLRAAEQMGYETHLAANAAFARSSGQPPWPAHPVYEHGFWASEGAPRWNLAASILAFFSYIRFRSMFAYQFSLPGLLWTYRDNLTEFIGVQMLRRGNLVELAPLVLISLLFKTLRFLFMLVMLPAAALVFLGRVLHKLLKIGRFPSGYLHHLTADVRDLGRFFQKTIGQRQMWMRSLQRRSHGKGFRRDTEKLLRLLSPGAGDIIFIPTISVTELAGLADLIESNPQARQYSWRLLFRRNIFVGRECDYQHQQSRIHETQESFQASAAKLRGAEIRFYTDTEELTRQYNRLNVFRFETAPIPHTHAPPSRSQGGNRLRILYVGDARGEKGYHLLPHIVENLWDRYVEPGRVSFHIQSNFNIPQGEPAAAVARGQLEHLARKKPGAVELFKEPLTSEQYRDLLLSGDINLLLYDASNYYARSSGILVESLSAGMPVIVPSGSWLSRQFQPAADRWRHGLPERMAVRETRRLGELKWKVQGRADWNPIVHGELTATHRNGSSTQIPIPAGSGIVLLRTRFDPSTTEAIFTFGQSDAKSVAVASAERLLETDGEGESTAVVRIHPAAARLRLTAASTRPGTVAQVRDLEIVFLAPRQAYSTPPLSAVGCTYDDISEISSLVEETIDHYGHYAETARAFAAGWRDYHNSIQLIRTLQGDPSPVAAEAAV